METTDLLSAAAEALLDPGGAAHRDAEVAGFLAWLGCPVPPAPGPAERHRARLFRAAGGFARLFRLDSPEAPGLWAFGAEVVPDRYAANPGFPLAGVSGTGLAPLEALESCIGEGVEYLSLVEMAEDAARLAPDDTLLAQRLDDGRSVPLPAARCLRRPPPLTAGVAGLGVAAEPRGNHVQAEPRGNHVQAEPRGNHVQAEPRGNHVQAEPRGNHVQAEPPWPLSIGCAAAPSAEAAALHGLLELVERDAAALWWRGGLRGRPIPLEAPAQAEAVALIATLRAGRARARRSWLLDITSDLGVPVVAAVSFAAGGEDPSAASGDDPGAAGVGDPGAAGVGDPGAAGGDGFCCGVASRPSMAAAARAALLEMAQMELAQAVVAAKRRERGEAGLNRRDRDHLARFRGIHAARCALVHPAGAPREMGSDLPARSPTEALAAVAARLAAQGLQPIRLDLTRPAFGIPVLRVHCSGLEVEPSRIVGPRLRAAIAITGGGAGHHGGIGLM